MKSYRVTIQMKSLEMLSQGNICFSAFYKIKFGYLFTVDFGHFFHSLLAVDSFPSNTRENRPLLAGNFWQ